MLLKEMNTESSMNIELEEECPDDLDQQEQDAFWMQQAIQLASYSESLGEVPVGAIVVQGRNRLSYGYNLSINEHDPTAHAEIMALREAGKAVKNYRLLDLTLYVTLEPCPMCASAMVHSRIKRVVYGANDLKTGAVDSVFNLTNSSLLNHQIISTSGVLSSECAAQISGFFKKRRAEIKARKKQNQTLNSSC